jgi:hypothetical protein
MNMYPQYKFLQSSYLNFLTLFKIYFGLLSFKRFILVLYLCKVIQIYSFFLLTIDWLKCKRFGLFNEVVIDSCIWKKFSGKRFGLFKQVVKLLTLVYGKNLVGRGEPVFEQYVFRWRLITVKWWWKHCIYYICVEKVWFVFDAQHMQIKTFFFSFFEVNQTFIKHELKI